MAATVLNSPRAVEVSLYVVRAFVQLREALAQHEELGAKLNGLERRIATHDQAIAGIIAAIRELTKSPGPVKKRPIGFVTDQKRD